MSLCRIASGFSFPFDPVRLKKRKGLGSCKAMESALGGREGSHQGLITFWKANWRVAIRGGMRIAKHPSEAQEAKAGWVVVLVCEMGGFSCDKCWSMCLDGRYADGQVARDGGVQEALRAAAQPRVHEDVALGIKPKAGSAKHAHQAIHRHSNACGAPVGARSSRFWKCA